mmetsp:Transcript_15352/g.33170  ORF Transcript_15352/g.33170 Transcript_15352/m.33170 type:complete len:657 (+) Transcript_15352:105-2075(+)
MHIITRTTYPNTMKSTSTQDETSSIPLPKIALTRHLSSNPPKTKHKLTSPASSSSPHDKNRLAPFSPTHITAQTKALELLRLKSNDVFFDLGCGDGRLVLLALEQALEREEDESKRQLYDNADDAELRCDEGNEECELGECIHVKKQRELQKQKHQLQTKQPLQHPLKSSQSPKHRSTPSGQHKRIYSLDQCSVPHLMRNSSQDSGDFEDFSLIDDTSTLQSRDTFHTKENVANESGHDVSWQSSLLGTPQEQQLNSTSRSPVTPLISNRKVIGNSSVKDQIHPHQFNIPPLETQRHSFKAAEVLYEDEATHLKEQEDAEIEEIKTLLLPSCKSTDIGDEEMKHKQVDDDGKTDNGTEESIEEVQNVAAAQRVGLRCIGIEYDRKLAETGQANIQKALLKKGALTEDLIKRACIRWGDVMDEWNRGNADLELEGQSSENSNASIEQLTLLNDATAIFVYLLPDGLKKVKPLLCEAATRNRTRRREMTQRQLAKGRTHQPDEVSSQEEEFNPRPLEFMPMPRTIGTHRKGSSHVSDITDYDFRSRTDYDFRVRGLSDLDHVNDCTALPGDINVNESEEEESDNLDENYLVHAHSSIKKNVSTISTLSQTTPRHETIPSLRIVSYMFSVPGWEPTKVDKSSKGGCPLYYYEDVDRLDC